MDLGFLDQYFVGLITGLCLVVGYIVKKWIKDVDHKYIPTLVAVAGVIFNVWHMRAISPEIVLAGAVSGLASTGLHQAFRQLIEKGRLGITEEK